ncbi:hypothetical protein DRN93_04355 [archaeon]|nr:MAG: hypothetical protein DRN93_04355 [archaeon]
MRKVDKFKERLQYRASRFIIDLILILFLLIATSVIPPLFHIKITGFELEPVCYVSWYVGIGITVVIILVVLRMFYDIRGGLWSIIDILFVKRSKELKLGLKKVSEDIIRIIFVVIIAYLTIGIVEGIPFAGDALKFLVGISAFIFFAYYLYDMSTTIYYMIEKRTEKIADWVADLAREKEKTKKG